MEMNYILGGFAEPFAWMGFCGRWMFFSWLPHTKETSKPPNYLKLTVR